MLHFAAFRKPKQRQLSVVHWVSLGAMAGLQDVNALSEPGTIVIPVLQQLSDEPMPPPQPQAQEDHGERKIWNEKAQSKIIFVMYSFALCLLVRFPFGYSL